MNSPRSPFPNPRKAPDDAPMAIGGDLSVATLLDAYTQGIFPWFSPGNPILWWCPHPRFVLEPARLRVPQSLTRRLKADWTVKADHAFAEVIQACADSYRPGQSGTWITDHMRQAYTELHEVGYAHSIEVWRTDKLIGGLYGVALGQVFFGESMFYRESDASKIALLSLVHFLREKNFRLIDCQQPTEHMARFGAEAWPRERFLDTLAELLQTPFRPGSWAKETFSPRPQELP